MDVITDHGELALLGAIETCRRKQSPQRCVRLSFGPMAAHPDIFSRVAALLEEINADLPHTALYQCEDGDLFLVGPQFSARRVEQFRERLSALPELSAGGDVSLHDASFEADDLVLILKEKLLGTASLTPKPRPAPQTASSPAAISPFDDKELIASIPQRRGKRSGFDILITDDDPFSVRLVQSSLKFPCRVLTAPTGSEALLSYVLNAPDMLFLDIGLPDMTGHDVLRRLLSMDPKADVVMLSGHGDIDNVRSAVQSGARGFVVKPFRADKLVQYALKSPHRKGALHGHRLER